MLLETTFLLIVAIVAGLLGFGWIARLAAWLSLAYFQASIMFAVRRSIRQSPS